MYKINFDYNIKGVYQNRVIANAHIKIGINSYEKVKTFKYNRTILEWILK